ncbi:MULTISPECIES: nucleoside-diphosphate kinase [unclassified Fusibacter]|uniref:nucleoside-diphosphate kinase n=1 Tax=unclassified Fusibacter TaxID=2624464 RepID=UPI0010123802|nr:MULTISPECIES: nucleoside-diphosphate kinase [unclassified Fusibacter]MCK8061554.1 nucleoside-diphosphate kinase [Fusibacter sp. A2]NPE23718.1 nucleoside-diphosphate kinase [Fusibacter sp. A1]RXV58745.1 nucleoside-diphosphate kinase [Fusibacter sp. A1]
MSDTLVLIKPDAVSKGLIGEIIRIYEINGLTIEDLKMVRPDKELLQKHYEEHLMRDFYPELEAFMMSGQVVALQIHGYGAVDLVRELNGSTNPQKARINTIRYLFGTSVQMNAVHGSADDAAAKRELSLWFDV